MDLKIARDTLKSVLVTGRMTVKAKEDIQSVINMMNDVLKRNEERDKAVEIGLSQSYSARYTERDVVNTMNFFCNHPKTYDIASDDLKKMQGMQEDILHALEFFDGEEADLMKYMNDLITIRKQRRVAKDYMELTQPVKTLSSKYPNIAKEIKQCLKKVREIKESQKQRVYKPRELTAMEEAFKKLEVDKKAKTEVNLLPEQSMLPKEQEAFAMTI